ncbi:MAG: DNA-formamidopyrimidine glycosylase [Firmicutes bacterium]|nr:DNA-formamidopyrimidine glycosylase [Bacillota bacterium]
MPEIAEVETVRNTLKQRVLNKNIIEVIVRYPKIIENDLEYFKKNLINEKFIDIKRIGKWLLFELDNYYLLSHLRMEGKYFLKNKDELYEKHEHVIIRFKDFDLRYHDTRKFGRMKIVKKDELFKEEAIKKQGVEANDQKNLTSNYLYELIKNKNIAIKTLLLDQSIISGLGNIYVNEVLFASKINPLKKGKELNIEDCQKIVNSSIEIINQAIKNGGTTIKSYTSSLGVTGRFQQYLKVHKQSNCPDCQKKLNVEKINGRTTYYCSKCQI